MAKPELPALRQPRLSSSPLSLKGVKWKCALADSFK
jgi:hypothetical protein